MTRGQRHCKVKSLAHCFLYISSEFSPELSAALQHCVGWCVRHTCAPGWCSNGRLQGTEHVAALCWSLWPGVAFRKPSHSPEASQSKSQGLEVSRQRVFWIQSQNYGFPKELGDDFSKGGYQQCLTVDTNSQKIPTLSLHVWLSKDSKDGLWESKDVSPAIPSLGT